MTSCLAPPPVSPSVHVPSAFPCTPSASRTALAASYATYVVRVHTRHGIKTLSFDTLAAFFTSTAKKAAEELGISSRTLIRVCRSLGIRRWPYLGFRSEKNVERIRQEAIDNLRRRLEKRGAGAAPVDAVLYPNASSHRGASAKRLLQVKLPGMIEPPVMLQNGESAREYAGHSRWMDLTGSSSDDEEPGRTVDADNSFMSAQYRDQSRITPHAVQQSFNLNVQRISPRKEADLFRQNAMHGAGWAPKPHQSMTKHALEMEAPPIRLPGASIPSLHLLVDASLLNTSQLERSTSPNAHTSQPQFRTMSMRDILTSSMATA